MFVDLRFLWFLARQVGPARSAIPRKPDDPDRAGAAVDCCGLCPSCRDFVRLPAPTTGSSPLCPSCGRPIDAVDPLGPAVGA